MKATGQKQAALDMYRQCYEIRVATLGRMHKDVALAMNNIAVRVELCLDLFLEAYVHVCELGFLFVFLK